MKICLPLIEGYPSPISGIRLKQMAKDSARGFESEQSTKTLVGTNEVLTVRMMMRSGNCEEIKYILLTTGKG
jgi:hypothetical protein